MLRSSTLLEHGPRLPVQRQWNTWLLAVVVAVVALVVMGAGVALVDTERLLDFQ